MNLSNPSRTLLSKIPGLNKAFDFYAARANNVFGAEHNNESGAHTNISANSIKLYDINNLGWFFWVDATGVLRAKNVTTQDASRPADLSGTIVGGVTKLYAANVTVTPTLGVPSNLDTYTISGLLATDKLLVVIDIETGEGNATYLYHSTGSTALTGAMTGGAEETVAVLGRAPTTSVFRVTRIVNGVLSTAAPNPGVAWTSPWTIAIRDDNATVVGAKHVSWWVGKLNG